MSERICVECKHSVMKIGTASGDTSHRAYCMLKTDETNGEPVGCESQRFAKADLDAEVCGSEGIFWEAKEI